MPRVSSVCAFKTCPHPERSSSSSRADYYLKNIEPCRHKTVSVHNLCSERMSKKNLMCHSCINDLSFKDIAGAGSKHAKARLNDYAKDPIGEAGRAIGRIADRTIGALESGMAGLENKKPHYATEYQRQGGHAIAGFLNPKSVPVRSFEGAVGRKTAEAAETGLKVYTKAAPVYKKVKASDAYNSTGTSSRR